VTGIQDVFVQILYVPEPPELSLNGIAPTSR
jgi:hypothetical protein